MQSASIETALERAAVLLEQAEALVITAGAGMGVDSGLPDFRGNEGFWQAYPALRRAGIDFTSIACPQAFHDHPQRAWGFYGHRLNLYRSTQPHAGFDLLRQWGEAKPFGYFVFTSNVDGQFQKAGFDPRDIHECHGSIHHLQCLRGCGPHIWPAEAFMPDVDETACLLRNTAPACPQCGGLARPNVMMFGDDGWRNLRERQQAARLQTWLASVKRPLVIELGAGTAIPSVRFFGESVIQHYGGRLVRINPREARVFNERDVGLESMALPGLSAIGEAFDRISNTAR